MKTRLYIIIGLITIIFVMIYIDNFTEGFEASHLADYYSSSYNINPDYTIADLHFAKRVTPPKGTTRPTGTSAPTGTTGPTGTTAL